MKKSAPKLVVLHYYAKNNSCQIQDSSQKDPLQQFPDRYLSARYKNLQLQRIQVNVDMNMTAVSPLPAVCCPSFSPPAASCSDEPGLLDPAQTQAPLFVFVIQHILLSSLTELNLLCRKGDKKKQRTTLHLIK